MTTQRKITVYQFSELSDKAKERVRDRERAIQDQLFDAEDFKTMTLQETVEHNFRLRTEDCHFSLSYCQGDGVAIYGDIDLDFLAGELEEGQGQQSAELRESIVAQLAGFKAADVSISAHSHGARGRNHHWNSMRVQVDWSASLDDPRDMLADLLRDENYAIPKAGDAHGLLVACDYADDRGLETANIRFLLAGEDAQYRAINKLQADLNEYLTAASRHAERVGYEELDYLASDAAIDELLEDTDRRFLKDGRDAD